MVWKRRMKLVACESWVVEAENALVRARSSSLARANAGRCREWRRRRKYFLMDRPNLTLRSFDGRAFSLRPGTGECSELGPFQGRNRAATGRLVYARKCLSSGVRGAEFLDGQKQSCLELLLGRLVEFGAADSEIEDVNGDLPLGIDQGHLDIATVRGQGGGDLAQETGAILGDHLQQGAVGGSGVIEFQACLNLDHDGGADGLAPSQQDLDGSLQGDPVARAAAEATHFRRIEFRS